MKEFELAWLENFEKCQFFFGCICYYEAQFSDRDDGFWWNSLQKVLQTFTNSNVKLPRMS